MKFVGSLALLAGICFAQTKITAVEGITEYRLTNGMDVLLFPDKTKPMVTVNVTYMVGSRFEGYGETGMAHLLEHMMFKGTTRNGDLKTELRNRGAEFNASTSYDRTNYFETLPASGSNLRWALEMEADRMLNSRIARADLDSKMTVVRSEFEMGENSPMRILEERVLSTAYLWHSYGRSTIGARSDIEHVPIERLQAFYHTYYQPDNAILVVAGNFDDSKTLGWVQEIFGALPKPSRKLTETYTEEPVQDGEREVVLRRTGGIQALMAAYHIPSGADADSSALEVLAEIFSAAPAGRLYKALVETKKAVSASAETYQLHDPGVMLFSAQVRKEGSLDDAEIAMIEVIDGIAKEPPSKEEVERAKTRLLKNIDLEMNNSQNVAIGLSEYQSMGDWRLLFLDRDRIKKVTPDDVARVAKAVSENVKPDHWPIHSDRSSGPRRDPRAAGCKRDGEGLQGPGRGGARRGVRSFAGEYRRAHGARDAAERNEARVAFEKDARGDGPCNADAALWRREEPVRQGSRRTDDRADADARDSKAHSAAASG